MDALGWIGGTMLAICGIPQAIQCAKDGHANGLNWGFIGLWGGGEILTLLYVFPKLDWPLLFNYTVNLLFLSPIVFYKLFPRG
jgi:uncharacterized protein with PQ loop repeat